MQNYLVLGLGVSGISASALLLDAGKKVFAFDHDKNRGTELRDAKLIDENVVIVNKLNKKLLSKIDCIVISPGFVLSEKLEKFCTTYNIPILSEVDLASIYCKSQIFGITGTNGKTTVVNFLYQIFSSAGYESAMLGNVGTTFSKMVNSLSPKTKVVLELSSFALEHCPHLRCAGVALLNVAPDHLNRYNSFSEYYHTKLKILDCVQDGGAICLNYDDEFVRLAGNTRPEAIYFSTSKLPERFDGYFIQDSVVYYQKKGEIKSLFSLDSVKFLGVHNYSNLLCAVALARSAKVSVEKIKSAVANLSLPKHRLEFVGEKDGVKFFDDSKATNIHSTNSALSSFDCPINLLLGGSDKGEDFVPFLAKMPKNVQNIVCFGKFGKKIFDIAKKLKLKNISYHTDLTSAFDFVKTVAKSGSVVLLSPACASFDEFASFVQRGEKFCQLTAEWLGEK